ncbi:hypothetical protein KEM54_005576 [Ascosphaera aggregata]|nr:hypothetical protein KEM54_005576 [Ascosphaera aggregata]
MNGTYTYLDEEGVAYQKQHHNPAMSVAQEAQCSGHGMIVRFMGYSAGSTSSKESHGKTDSSGQPQSGRGEIELECIGKSLFPVNDIGIVKTKFVIPLPLRER